MIKFIITDIDWGDHEEGDDGPRNLPTELVYECNEPFEDQDERDAALSDKMTEEWCFCVNGFVVEERIV